MVFTLVGMPGCGKSSIGRELSMLLSLPFIDLDEYIESYSGKSVLQIFDSDGEDAFRRLESECLRRILDEESDLVLALGGGTLTQEDLVGLVRKHCLGVYLSASPETLAKRLRSEDSKEVLKRPLFAYCGIPLIDRLGELLSIRESAYIRASKFRIATDGLTPAEVAVRITAELKLY